MKSKVSRLYGTFPHWDILLILFLAFLAPSFLDSCCILSCEKRSESMGRSEGRGGWSPELEAATLSSWSSVGRVGGDAREETRARAVGGTRDDVLLRNGGNQWRQRGRLDTRWGNLKRLEARWTSTDKQSCRQLEEATTVECRGIFGKPWLWIEKDWPALSCPSWPDIFQFQTNCSLTVGSETDWQVAWTLTIWWKITLKGSSPDRTRSLLTFIIHIMSPIPLSSERDQILNESEWS